MKPANYAPVYACVYAQLAEIARSHGYAMAAHGSLARDFDLICIPWAAEVSEPQAVVDQITREFAIEQVTGFEQKEHGRTATTISFSFGECRLDLSFMPAQQEQSGLTDLLRVLERTHAGHMVGHDQSDQPRGGYSDGYVKGFGACIEVVKKRCSTLHQGGE